MRPTRTTAQRSLIYQYPPTHDFDLSRFATNPTARLPWRNMMDSVHPLKPPSAENQALALQAIAALWHHRGNAQELLGQMQATRAAPDPGPPVTLHAGGRLTTPERFRTPVTFQIVVLTNLSDMRIGYAFDQIIFNWEMENTELRVDGGPDRGLHPKPGVGQLPINQWAGIEFTVTPSEAILYVNGAEIDRLAGDFSNIEDSFYIEGHNGPVEIQSVRVVR